ncbi:hypothetical protein ACIRTB_21065 [Streptomyces sp. NPDC101158]
MDTKTALVLALSGIVAWIAYHRPQLGAAIGVGIAVAALLLQFLP